jgi:hypothetical protein
MDILNYSPRCATRPSGTRTDVLRLDVGIGAMRLPLTKKRMARSTRRRPRADRAAWNAHQLHRHRYLQRRRERRSSATRAAGWRDKVYDATKMPVGNRRRPETSYRSSARSSNLPWTDRLQPAAPTHLALCSIAQRLMRWPADRRSGKPHPLRGFRS